MDKKIIMIIPYFGKFPSNIDLTLKSMEMNQNITWMFFSDNVIERKYKNINFIYMSFEDMKFKIKQKVGTNISTPYKLCDYKPLYGILFDEYINGYDFWGYCDIDVVFGNIKKFIDNNILSRYDKILELGHFSLYRNIKEINYMYLNTDKYGISYQQILESDNIYVFDENYSDEHIDINYLLLKNGYKIYCNKKIYADLDIKYNNFYPLNYKRKKQYFFEYQNGTLNMLSNKEKNVKVEFLYVHFQQKKNLPIKVTNMNNYIITPKGFFDIGKINYNKFYKIKNLKLFWYLKFRVKRKLAKIVNI